MRIMQTSKLLVGIGFVLTLAWGACSEEGGGGKVDAADTLTADDGGGDDQGGEDAGQTDTPDDPGPGDADATADPGEDEGSADPGAPDAVEDQGSDVTDAWATYCEQRCSAAYNDCGDLSALWADAEACEADCSAKIAVDLDWVASFECIAESCDTGTCFGGDPLPTAANCDTACERLTTCGLAALVEMDTTKVTACPALCTGALASGGTTQDTIDCVAGVSLDDCRTTSTGVVGCLLEQNPPGDACDSFCVDAFEDGGADDDLFCDGDSALVDQWASVDACKAACAAQPAWKAFAMGQCLRIRECVDPAPCLDIPDIFPEGCLEACDAVRDKCEGLDYAQGTSMLCGPSCTGIVRAYGVTSAPEDGAACVAAWEQCPDQDFDRELLACVMTPDPSCVQWCPVIAGCLPADQMTLDECLNGCAQTAIQTPDLLAGVVTCVDAAGDDCDAVAACIPE